MGDGPGDERGARVSELRGVGNLSSNLRHVSFQFHFLLLWGIIGKPVVHISSFYFSILFRGPRNMAVQESRWGVVISEIRWGSVVIVFSQSKIAPSSQRVLHVPIGRPL